MKRIACIIGIILLTSLLIAGCAPQKEITQDITSEEPADESKVTQEDLDKLKADLEKLEAEDLGGLSSE